MGNWLGVANQFSVILNGLLSNSATTMVLSTGDGARCTAVGFPFYLDFGYTPGDPPERVKLTSLVGGDTVNIVRGQGPDVAAGHVGGAVAKLRVVAEIINELHLAVDTHIHDGTTQNGPVLDFARGGTRLLVTSSITNFTAGSVGVLDPTNDQKIVINTFGGGYDAMPAAVVVNPSVSPPVIGSTPGIGIGGTGYVVTKGLAWAAVTGAAITRGDLLWLSATAGYLEKAPAANSPGIVGRALTNSAASRCLVELYSRPDDHLRLRNVGANTHAQVDTHMGAAVGVHGLPAANAVGVLANDGAGSLLWTPPPRNLITNGDFAVAQTGTLISPWPNANLMGLDAWYCLNTSTVILSQQQVSAPNAITGPLMMGTYSYVTTSNGKASLIAGDVAGLFQLIEGANAKEFAVQGGALTFWCYATVTGRYSVCIGTRGAHYTFVRDFQVTGGNWTPVSIVIPPPSAAATGDAGDFKTQLSFRLYIILLAGSNYQSANLGVWKADNLVASPNQVNGMAAANNAFYLHAMQMVPGQIPHPYYPEPFSANLARCQRYREVHGFFGAANSQVVGYTAAAQLFGMTRAFAVPKGGVPTMSKLGTWNVVNCAQPIITNACPDSYFIYAVANPATGQSYFNCDSADDGVVAEWIPG